MKKILLIDDDIDFLNLLVNTAKDFGWNPSKADSVATAKECLLKEQYDTISIDYSLGDGTAVDILNYITEHAIASRTVVLSGYDENRIRNVPDL